MDDGGRIWAGITPDEFQRNVKHNSSGTNHESVCKHHWFINELTGAR